MLPVNSRRAVSTVAESAVYLSSLCVCLFRRYIRESGNQLVEGLSALPAAHKPLFRSLSPDVHIYKLGRSFWQTFVCSRFPSNPSQYNIRLESSLLIPPSNQIPNPWIDGCSTLNQMEAFDNHPTVPPHITHIDSYSRECNEKKKRICCYIVWQGGTKRLYSVMIV